MKRRQQRGRMKFFSYFLAAVSFSSFVTAQNNNTLRLEKGQKYLVENKVATSNVIQMMGQSVDNNTDMTSTYKIEVTGNEGDNYNLTNTITNIRMNLTMMGQEMKFDSDNKEDLDGQIGSAFKNMINQPKQVKLDKAGKVIVTDNDSSSLVAKELNFDVAGFGSQLAFQALPSDLKKGATWTEKIEDEGNSRITTYTVKEINGNMATITFTGSLSNQNTIEQSGMELKQKTSGDFSGEETVDIQTGIIQSNTSITNATGAVTAMGQDMPIVTKITSATTVKSL